MRDRFTPGPWELIEAEDVRPFWKKPPKLGDDLPRPDGVTREKVRYVASGKHSCSVAIIPEHASEADAALILAAPDLLAALKEEEAISEAERRGIPLTETVNHMERKNKALALRRAAIAKADRS